MHCETCSLNHSLTVLVYLIDACISTETTNDCDDGDGVVAGVDGTDFGARTCTVIVGVGVGVGVGVTVVGLVVILAIVDAWCFCLPM